MQLHSNESESDWVLDYNTPTHYMYDRRQLTIGNSITSYCDCMRLFSVMYYRDKSDYCCVAYVNAHESVSVLLVNACFDHLMC